MQADDELNAPHAFQTKTSRAKSNHIEHTVSKMDTLAGVAIKYGVEIADIKRLNGLVTDHQMFAHKSLQIPLPGRHPPSPVSSENGFSTTKSKRAPAPRSRMDTLDSFSLLKLKPPKNKASPAMSSLQGYYGLKPPKRNPMVEGTEMAVYITGKRLSLDEKLLPTTSPNFEPPNRHRRSTSLVNNYLPENGKRADDTTVANVSDDSDVEKCSSGKSVRRRQKADADPLCTSELVEDGRESSARIGEGSALGPAVIDIGLRNPGDSIKVNGLTAVRKSSSTSNLQDSDNFSSSTWLASKWSLKPDVIARPIIDGLPKPMNVWRNKAARD